MCSHPHEGDATAEKTAGKKSREIQRAEIFATKYNFVAPPVRRWLQVRFSSRTGNATISKKLIAPAMAVALSIVLSDFVFHFI